MGAFCSFRHPAFGHTRAAYGAIVTGFVLLIVARGRTQKAAATAGAVGVQRGTPGAAASAASSTGSCLGGHVLHRLIRPRRWTAVENANPAAFIPDRVIAATAFAVSFSVDH